MEDETKVLSDEEQKAPTTQPMLKEILERLNAGFAEINQRLTALEKAVHTLERKFDVFSIESTNIKASVLDTVNRLEELERKAS